MLLIVAALAAAALPPPPPPPAPCRDARGRIILRCLPKGTVVTGPLPVTLEPAAEEPPAPARKCRDRRGKPVSCRKGS